MGDVIKLVLIECRQRSQSPEVMTRLLSIEFGLRLRNKLLFRPMLDSITIPRLSCLDSLRRLALHVK